MRLSLRPSDRLLRARCSDTRGCLSTVAIGGDCDSVEEPQSVLRENVECAVVVGKVWDWENIPCRADTRRKCSANRLASAGIADNLLYVAVALIMYTEACSFYRNGSFAGTLLCSYAACQSRM